MNFDRFYTNPDTHTLDVIELRPIYNEDGREYTVPKSWSDEAVEVLLSKGFYKGKVPSEVMKIIEKNVPEFLSRSSTKSHNFSYETDFKALARRLAGSITYRLQKSGLFGKDEDAQNFYEEFLYCFVNRIALIDVNLWGVLGVNWAYGVDEAECLDLGNKIFAFNGGFENLKTFAQTKSLENSEKLSITFDAENSECKNFIKWKSQAEQDRVARELGRNVITQAAGRIIDACDRGSFFGFDPNRNLKLKAVVEEVKSLGVSDSVINLALRYAEQGYEEIKLNVSDEEAEFETAIESVISIPDQFIESALTGHSFAVYENSKPKANISACELLETLAESVWSSGEPSIIFRDNVNSTNSSYKQLHTSASGGFIFLPNSEAPSASINILALAGKADNVIDIKAVDHVVKIFTTALDVLNNDNDYRPLMLSTTNMAELLLAKGIAYDSNLGRATVALVFSFISASAYNASALIANKLGAFDKYIECEKNYLKIIKNKIAILSDAALLQKGLTRRPIELNFDLAKEEFLNHTTDMWRDAYITGKSKGFRNAHLTAVDTSIDMQRILGGNAQNLNPMSSIIVFDYRAAYGKTLNPAVISALKFLGYSSAQIEDIGFYILGHGSLVGAPYINHSSLKAKGFDEKTLMKVEKALVAARNIYGAFNSWVLGDEGGLQALGFKEDEIEEANLYCCGALTIEGAPHLKPEHLNVFDCAMTEASGATRKISPEAQIKMQASVETFISGGVAGVIILNHYVSIDEVKAFILKAWEIGVKRLKIYRERCSLLSPAIIGIAQTPEASIEVKEESKVKKLKV